jgi:hypothetical protein
MDIVRWWFSGDTRWIGIAVLGGLGILLLAVLAKALLYVAHYGLRNDAKAAFRWEGETVRLIAILLLVGAACAMAFTGAGGVTLGVP